MKPEPVVSVRAYLWVWFGLIILTLTTTGVAFVDLGAEWNSVAALIIASAKTTLVVLYFMHLRYSGKLTWVFASAGVFWLLLLLGGTLDDVITRERVFATPAVGAAAPAQLK
jgi:cytochrome c oxidase subunit IV